MQCRICRSKNYNFFFEINNYPIVSGPVISSKAPPVKTGKISIGFCFNCGSCTLIEPAAEDITYTDDYTSSNMSVTLGAKIDRKMVSFLNFLEQVNFKKKLRVLEIGSYDGALIASLRDKFGLEAFGCEPVKKVADLAVKRYGLKIKNNYFSADLYEKDFFNVVIFRNVLEHIYNPVEFLADVWQITKDGGKIVLDVPDGELRISEGITGSIVPEHANYFGADSLRLVLILAGFDSIKIQKHRGSLRAQATKRSVNNGRIKFDREKIIRTYNQLEKGAKKNLQKHQKIGSLLKDAENVYIFGANTCSLELLAAGDLINKKIRFILDDDPLKWKQVMVNTKIEIKPRQDCKSITGPKTFIICSYYFHEDLFNFLRKNLEPPFDIIRLYPEIKLVKTK